jgi:hypothetical protein
LIVAGCGCPVRNPNFTERGQQAEGFVAAQTDFLGKLSQRRSILILSKELKEFKSLANGLYGIYGIPFGYHDVLSLIEKMAQLIHGLSFT